jgi:glycosyltransferase involved in cell wall biosynthesis
MKVSIITINRNNLSGLKATRESIISQTYKDWEWIVVDGGSTEGDRDFLEQHANEMAWWCSEPDSGVYNAQNKGIAHAMGEWMIFMNSGDIFHDKNVLESVFAQEHSADILYGDWIRVYEDGREEKMSAPERLSLHYIYQKNICHQAIFVKSAILVASPYDESYKVLADWAKWIELMLKKYTFEYLSLTVCDFSVGGISSGTVQAFAELEILRKKEFPPALTETIETLEKTGYDDRNISDVWKLVRQRNTYRRIIHAAVRLCRFIEKIRS